MVVVVAVRSFVFFLNLFFFGFFVEASFSALVSLLIFIRNGTFFLYITTHHHCLPFFLFNVLFSLLFFFYISSFIYMYSVFVYIDSSIGSHFFVLCVLDYLHGGKSERGRERELKFSFVRHSYNRYVCVSVDFFSPSISNSLMRKRANFAYLLHFYLIAGHNDDKESKNQFECHFYHQLLVLGATAATAIASHCTM